MGIIKNLFGRTPAKPDKRFHKFSVKCSRCGEIIEGRVDLDNDLSLNDDGEGYFARKMLMGNSGKCFQQIEVEMQFSPTRELTGQDIHGGTFME